MGDLDRLINVITTHWKFDDRSYPAIKGKSLAEVQRFALNHSALHFANTAGKIVGALERIDHGAEMDIDDLKMNTGKMLINTLMLAHQLGLSGDDLARFVEDKYKGSAENNGV